MEPPPRPSDIELWFLLGEEGGVRGGQWLVKLTSEGPPRSEYISAAVAAYMQMRGHNLVIDAEREASLHLGDDTILTWPHNQDWFRSQVEEAYGCTFPRTEAEIGNFVVFCRDAAHEVGEQMLLGEPDEEEPWSVDGESTLFMDEDAASYTTVPRSEKSDNDSESAMTIEDLYTLVKGPPGSNEYRWGYRPHYCPADEGLWSWERDGSVIWLDCI